MAIRRGWAAGAALASVVLMAGCSSGSGSSGTTAAASTSTSSAATSSAAATAASGGEASLDAQSVTWFETMCDGLAPLSGIQQKATASTTGAEAASALADAGTAMTDTATQLSELPPPNVENGEALATSVVAGLKGFGTTFSDFSARAATLKEGDTAGLQQFATDLQTALSSSSPLGTVPPSAEVQAQVRKLPSCQAAFGS